MSEIHLAQLLATVRVFALLALTLTSKGLIVRPFRELSSVPVPDLGYDLILTILIVLKAAMYLRD